MVMDYKRSRPNFLEEYEVVLGHAMHWQRSASQSSDRWTTFALGGPHVWQRDLGIMIQHFSRRTARSNSELVEPRVHWHSQTWSLLQNRPFIDYSVSMYESERRKEQYPMFTATYM